jgi:signal transduction histidine kinase/ActR/RegA family two-component response regulator
MVKGRLSLVVVGLVAGMAALAWLAGHDYSDDSRLFHPHGYCYLWMPSLVAAHVSADGLIGLSYTAITITLIYLVWRARRGLPFTWMFVAFGGFIIACGATHLMEVWTLWQPLFWLSAAVKIVTAGASVATAVALPPLVPKVLTLIGDARLSQERAEELARAHAELERRVEERTRDLLQALERAEQANRAKETFLATVSHELRTPLNAILGWADILDQQPRPELIERAVPVIRRNAAAQARVIDDLLDVSSIEAGKMRIEPQPTDVRAVVANALDAIRPSADAKSVQLHSSGDESLAFVHGDPARLQQIVWNLLSNAVKFSFPGGVVRVRCITDARLVRLDVSDDGIGIDPAFLPRIFDQFSQADPSTTRGHMGLGLGLAIVRHLVELQGGKVRAFSEGLGRGARLTVELPRHTLSADSDDQPDSVDVRSDLRGLRVLVVDDDADSRETIARILEAVGASTVVAESASTGIQRLLQHDVDVIVSDIAMPHRDGIAFIEDVRRLSHEVKRTVPAVALTALARDDDRQRVLAAGFQKHASKPVSADQLVRCVAAVVGG